MQSISTPDISHYKDSRRIDPKASNPVEAQMRAFGEVRQQTLELISGLSAEDCQVQSMPDASPVKWHLAHTSWFFEAFVLANCPNYQVFHPQFGFLFNSYYEGEGPRHPRQERGLLTRPALDEVLSYRESVNAAILGRLKSGDFSADQKKLITLGLHHEQQHQELLITDILHALSRNAVDSSLKQDAPFTQSKGLVADTVPQFEAFEAGLRFFGADSNGFSYDNEGPRHQVYVSDFEIARSVVTNQQYREFVRAGGYENPAFWLSDGWHWLTQSDRKLPLYWRNQNGLQQFTVTGWGPLQLEAPVCHLSYYEASAFAQWASCRLPTEFEWEVAAKHYIARGAKHGRSLESGHWCPGGDTSAWLGNVWEWTSSAYAAYPGFQAAEGSVGEYNGKFMCGQQVLRGGSCVTPRHHIRTSYRNFFPPHAQWQFSGLRLARS